MSDLIRREDAIDAVLTFLVEYCGAAFDEDMQKMLCERLDALPSAEPERKPGKWLHKPNEYDDDTYECSQCGEPWTLIEGTPKENNMNFCPNCGADMTR